MGQTRPLFGKTARRLSRVKASVIGRADTGFDCLLLFRTTLLLIFGYCFQSFTHKSALAPALPTELCRSINAIFRRETNEGKITMCSETIYRAPASQSRRRGRYLLIYPVKAHAQIVGDVEANIPFAFHAGNAKLPAGQYRIHVLDDSDLTVMEITSADGSTSALFQVQEAEANTAPAKSELIFNKSGNRYFLAKLFQEGSPRSSQVLASRYQKGISQQTQEGREHVPAHHERSEGINCRKLLQL